MADYKDNPIGNCPQCGKQLKRTGHRAGTGKGLYTCTNYGKCTNRQGYNRHGDPR